MSLIDIIFYAFQDLKKGLIKVMDKQYEPIIAALLTDTNQTDVDRIYESLYVRLYKKLDY